MIIPSTISSFLQQPTTIQECDSYEIEKWVNKYPYFNLLQYIKSIKAGSLDTATVMHLYPANPVLTSILAQTSRGNYHFADITVAEEPATQEETYGDILEEILATSGQAKDYFSHNEVSNDLPDYESIVGNAGSSTTKEEEEQLSLMRVMSFTEWLSFLAQKNKKEKEEEESKRLLKAMWQKEKLSKALEDETEEIPEEVFNMAVNSLSTPQDITNESMAEVYVRQSKFGKAIEIYQKLSLLYPEKSVYFASKIEKLKKES